MAEPAFLTFTTTLPNFTQPHTGCFLSAAHVSRNILDDDLFAALLCVILILIIRALSMG